MAFFKNVKRALGFSGNDDNDDYNTDSYQGKDKGREPYINPFKKESADSTYSVSDVIKMSQETINADETESDGVPEGLFDGVVDVLNSAMPELVKECIDKDAQKTYLYNMLGESFRDYVKRLQEKAVTVAQGKWDKERGLLTDKLHELEARVNEADRHKDEARNQFLSLERQKRAVSERVHDLETRVASLESEIEQYQLENKSLLNKLKVSQVKGDDIDYFKNEIGQYQAEINSYKKKIAEYSEMDNRIGEFEKRIEELVNENAVLKSAGGRLKDEEMKLDVSNSLVTDLNERIRSTGKDNDALRREVEELREKIKLDAEELESIREELSEANSGLEIVADIQEQLDRVEEMKGRKDAKIASLSARVSELEKERDLLLSKEASYDNTDMSNSAEVVSEKETSVAEPAHDETITDDLISFDGFHDLDIISDDTEEVFANEDSESRDEPLKISAIDESLDDIDWLIPTPPTPAPEPEIREETVKPVDKPADSSQMTLF